MEESNVREGIRRDDTGDLFENSSIENTEQTVGGRSTFVRPLGKYAPLALHLRGLEGPECLLKFSEVEKIIGSGLPGSARNRRTGWLWWSNDISRTQARNGWLAAGWQVSKVDYVKSVVYLWRRV